MPTCMYVRIYVCMYVCMYDIIMFCISFVLQQYYHFNILSMYVCIYVCMCVIVGEEEAIFSWAATNFLMGSLLPASQGVGKTNATT